jgi:hypothetical protein
VTLAGVRCTFTVISPGTTDTITASISTPDITIRAASPATGDGPHNHLPHLRRLRGVFS